jgi:hypothetical protein
MLNHPLFTCGGKRGFKTKKYVIARRNDVAIPNPTELLYESGIINIVSCLLRY